MSRMLTGSRSFKIMIACDTTTLQALKDILWHFEAVSGSRGEDDVVRMWATGL